jgi:hypothetical protein
MFNNLLNIKANIKLRSIRRRRTGVEVEAIIKAGIVLKQ